jgi:ribose transport system ATP-binding protein
VRDVDFDVSEGEVRGLVGENGAGKSTLVKVMTGALAADAGTVEIGGKPLTRASPAQANRLGLTALHQERFIAGDISVAENILLGHVPTRQGRVDWRSMYEEAERTLQQLGLSIDPRVPAGELTISDQQGVELARALRGESPVIVMDEPTASLSGAEAMSLFATIRRLHEANKTVIYISHHLEELFEIATSVTVMRDGVIVGTYAIEELDVDKLLALMFGRQINAQRRRSGEETPGDERNIVLLARDVHCRPYLRGTSLELHQGEILGLTGTNTSGRIELARCLAGVLSPDSGTVEVAGKGDAGKLIAVNRREAARVAFLPDDRKREGILPDLDVVENIDVARLARARTPFVIRKSQLTRVRRWVEQLNVRAGNLRVPVRNLSGGNQQKTIIARWLNADARIFVLDEPTAGVDVNTKLELYDRLRQLARDGAAVVFFSSDYEELKLLADRVLIMRRGVIVRQIDPERVSEEAIFAEEMDEVRA